MSAHGGSKMSNKTGGGPGVPGVTAAFDDIIESEDQLNYKLGREEHNSNNISIDNL